MPTMRAELGEPRAAARRPRCTPTTPTLASDLPVSTSALGPKRFLAPETGLMLLEVGLERLAARACSRPARRWRATPASEADQRRSARTAEQHALPAPIMNSLPMPWRRRRSGVRDLGERRCASRRPSRWHDARARRADSANSAGEQDDRAVEVRRACATWPFLRASSRLLGCCLLGLVAGHRATPIAREAASAGRPAAARSPIQPATNGSEAPTSSRPTMILAGKPTAKTLSCGTTRETTPKAASVRISASSTGAAISMAETKIERERGLRRRRRARPSAGAASSADERRRCARGPGRPRRRRRSR